MNDNVLRYIKRVFNLITILGFVATIVGGIYLWRLGAFQNQAVLQQLIVAHRFLGPLIFLCMQILQVIVPIIPGGITMAAGVMIFDQFGVLFIITLELLRALFYFFTLVKNMVLH